MNEWKWSKANEKELAKFVNEKAIELLPKLPENRFDLVQKKNKRRQLVEAIYKTLVSTNIRYAHEKYHPEEETQLIRTPSEILFSPGEGTCLDLALLFCGLCFGCDLLPLLIVIDGHALAAVSLSHKRQQWDDHKRTLFNNLELFQGQDSLAKLIDLIGDEDYIAVECTGFAHTDSFTNSEYPEAQERESGFLNFSRALKAGNDQLSYKDRPFKFAIDIAVAQYYWKIKPLEILITSNTKEQLSGKSAINIDNVENSTAIGNDTEAQKGNYESTINARNSEGLRLTGNIFRNEDEVKKN